MTILSEIENIINTQDTEEKSYEIKDVDEQLFTKIVRKLATKFENDDSDDKVEVDSEDDDSDDDDMYISSVWYGDTHLGDFVENDDNNKGVFYSFINPEEFMHLKPKPIISSGRTFTFDD